MSTTFTDEQLRNWAENVTEPTVRDLAQALLAKTAECEAWRSEAIVRQHELDEARASYCKAADERTAERQRADAAERQREASAKALEVEREWRLSPHGGNEATVERLTKERDDARSQLAQVASALGMATDCVAELRRRCNDLEAQLAKVPHLQPLGDDRHVYLVNIHAPGEERDELTCARLGGRCAALAAETEHRADPEAGTE